MEDLKRLIDTNNSLAHMSAVLADTAEKLKDDHDFKLTTLRVEIAEEANIAEEIRQWHAEAWSEMTTTFARMQRMLNDQQAVMRESLDTFVAQLEMRNKNRKQTLTQRLTRLEFPATDATGEQEAATGEDYSHAKSLDEQIEANRDSQVITMKARNGRRNRTHE